MTLIKDGAGEPFTGFYGDGTDIFVVQDGIKIAKRGHPGTKHAKKWISLEPGFTVRDAGDLDEIIVEYTGVGTVVQ